MEHYVSLVSVKLFIIFMLVKKSLIKLFKNKSGKNHA